MDAEKMEREYKALLMQLGHGGGVRPNDLQADPWNVPYPGGPAGYTLRDMVTDSPNPWRY